MGASITTADLRALGAQCDLDGIGAAPALPVPVDAAAVRARLAGPLPAELSYLRRRIEDRLDPRRLLPQVRSVVAAYVAYAGPQPGVEALPPGAAFVSRFAWSRDYHLTVGERMDRLASLLSRPGLPARAYVDTGPVFEKAYAAAAGLGFIGRNTLLVTPAHGSFVFLGVVLASLEVEPTGPFAGGGCGPCRACVGACPTGALADAGLLDPARCLAHLNASSREPIPPPLAPLLRGNLYGCDLCQDTCPWNARAARPGRPEFRPLPGLYMPRARDVAAMDDAGLERMFGATPARRRGAELLRHTASLLVGREGRPT
jgi:epoxyqueuosine reductase